MGLSDAWAGLKNRPKMENQTMNDNLPATIPTDLTDRIDRYTQLAKGALSDNTERAYRADTAVFNRWCAEQGREPLPASPETVAAFIDEMAENHRPATIRRYIAALTKLHTAAGLPSPARSEIVRLAIKRMNRSRGTRQEQATALTRDVIDRIIASCGDSLIDLRNIALVSLAYDTLTRRSEIVGINVEDISVSEDGNGTVLIRRSKTDQEGAGDVRFLAADTVSAIQRWTEAAQIQEGALFRSVSKGGVIGKRIDTRDVPRIFKRLADRAGVAFDGISGHSTRVGAAQDMAAAGLGVTEIMQSGGWKSPTMVGRYTERLMARRGAAAKLAALQGRAPITNGTS